MKEKEGERINSIGKKEGIRRRKKGDMKKKEGKKIEIDPLDLIYGQLSFVSQNVKRQCVSILLVCLSVNKTLNQ